MVKLTDKAKQDIATALQGAVKKATGSGGVHKCQLDAYAGCVLLKAITDLPYEFVAVDTTLHLNSADHHLWWTYPEEYVNHGKTGLMPTSVDQLDLQHCFIRRPEGKSVEIVDFSTWQLDDYLKSRWGFSWGFSPPFVWSLIEDISPRFKRFYLGSPAADHSEQLSSEIESKHMNTIRRIVGLAVDALEAGGYSRPSDEMFEVRLV